MIDKILSGNYLKERSKIRLLVATIPFLLVILLTLSINLLLGMSHLSGTRNLFVSIISMGVISLLLMVPIIALGEYELAATFCIVVHLYVDWYLGARFVALGLILVLLLVYYRTRSPQQIWVFPRLRGFWLLLVLLAIFPALRGYTLQDGATYYLTVLLTPIFAFWLGNLLAQDKTRIERLFQFLSGFGALLAILALIQVVTGKLLFSSPRFDQYLAQTADFQLAKGGGIHRTGTFFINPDTNGTFFAVIGFLPLGLFFASTTRRAKLFYLIETFLIALALLSSYSVGAWIAGAVALLLFFVMLGNVRLRWLVPGLIALILTILALLVSMILMFSFRTPLSIRLRHIATLHDLAERVIGWQVATRVIEAFPLTGLGLGTYAYRYRAPAFRVQSSYYIPLAHPHNSFLEIAAMGGIPLLLVFLALLCLGIWWARRNRAQAEGQTRILLTGSIAAVIAMCANSFSSNSWTLAPLAALGWLILGVVSSPLLANKSSRSETEEQEQKSNAQKPIDERFSRSVFLNR